MAFKSALVCLVLIAAVAAAQAYPQFWAQKYAPSCTAVPTKGADCHKAPEEDKATTITVKDASGKVVTSVCPGKSYSINVNFPNPRFSWVSLSGSTQVSVQNDSNKRCPNSAVFSGKTGHSVSTAVMTSATAPSSGSWDVAVVSATGKCAPFMVTKASVPVGKC